MIIFYELTWSTTPAVTAPIAIGTSVTINVREQACPMTPRPNGPPVGSSCNPFYAPAQLAVVVAPMRASGQPCPLTVRQTAPGTLVATRTGPGDPNVTVGSMAGGCELTIRDPQTTAFSTIVDV